MKKAAIIFNPNSRQFFEKEKSIIESINKLCNMFQYSLEFCDCNNSQFYKDWHFVDMQYDNSIEADILFVVGGDGTKSHIINKLIHDEREVILYGLPTGSINIGTLNSINGLEEIDGCMFQLSEAALDAIVISKNGKKKIYAFHDVILSDACITSLDGKITTVDSKNLFKYGEKIQKSITLYPTNNIKVTFVRDKAVARNIDISFDYAFIGCGANMQQLKYNILAGAADPYAVMGYNAGFIISNIPLIINKEEAGCFIDKIPESMLLPLDHKSIITIDCFNENTWLVCDGNVVDSIIPGDTLSFSFEKSVYKIMRCL